MTRTAYDLAIIGAGPAGSALALRAARGGAAVLLIDRDCFAKPRFGETAPPDFRRALAGLKLCSLLDRPEIARDAPAIVSVWGQDEPMERHHITSPFASAIHLDRCRFDAALVREAARAGATVRLGSRVSVMRGPGGDYRLEFRTAEVAHARFLALATGRSARPGGFRQERLYLNDHVCLVGYLAGESHDGRTLIEAVADGWIYAAALPGQRTVAALTVCAGSVPRDAGARQAFWRTAIARSRLVGPALAGLSLVGRLHVVNSRASAAARIGGATWCLLGDARIAPDPLSGQGLLWALDDAATAATALLASRSNTIADELAARSRSSLPDHCRAAAMIYGMERRFADAPFWRKAARVDP